MSQRWRACSFDRNYILVDDLEYFLPRAKAVKAFEMLDVDCDGQVSLHDIRDAVLQIYRVSIWPVLTKQQLVLPFPSPACRGQDAAAAARDLHILSTHDFHMGSTWVFEATGPDLHLQGFKPCTAASQQFPISSECIRLSHRSSGAAA